MATSTPSAATADTRHPPPRAGGKEVQRCGDEKIQVRHRRAEEYQPQAFTAAVTVGLLQAEGKGEWRFLVAPQGSRVGGQFLAEYRLAGAISAMATLPPLCRTACCAAKRRGEPLSQGG